MYPAGPAGAVRCGQLLRPVLVPSLSGSRVVLIRTLSYGLDASVLGICSSFTAGPPFNCLEFYGLEQCLSFYEQADRMS